MDAADKMTKEHADNLVTDRELKKNETMKQMAKAIAEGIASASATTADSLRDIGTAIGPLKFLRLKYHIPLSFLTQRTSDASKFTQEVMPDGTVVWRQKDDASLMKALVSIDAKDYGTASKAMILKYHSAMLKANWEPDRIDKELEHMKLFKQKMQRQFKILDVLTIIRIDDMSRELVATTLQSFQMCPLHQDILDNQKFLDMQNKLSLSGRTGIVSGPAGGNLPPTGRPPTPAGPPAVPRPTPTPNVPLTIAELLAKAKFFKKADGTCSANFAARKLCKKKNVCEFFNRNRCTIPQCTFSHTCAVCGGAHSACDNHAVAE